MFASARNGHMPEVLAMIHYEKYTPVPAIALTVSTRHVSKYVRKYLIDIALESINIDKTK